VPHCSTSYTVVEKDTLGNVKQGGPDKSLKWLQVDLEKKYPGVCYAPPTPSVTTVFYISIAPATYNGTRIVTNTANTTGNVSDNNGNNGTYNGTTTSSTAVPYSMEYGRYMLTVETLVGEKVTARHRFVQDGLYRTMYGIPLGGRGHHPEKALIEDAVKWIHNGGLADPLQSSQ
jgi:hypothetical protein